jgi:hypothetical protein
MQPELRQSFNQQFSQVSYQEFLEAIKKLAPEQLDFRVAETPVFIPADLKNKMLQAGEDFIDALTNEHFKSITESSIPDFLSIPGENEFPEMMVFDFGICKNKNGDYEPQLIEIQGFPSLFCFQYFSDLIYKQHFHVPENYSSYLNGYNSDSYLQLLKEIILDKENPEHVILLELFPEQQKTRIDFACTEKLLGIKTVCLTKLIAEGNELFYKNEGVKTKIKRIFNRIIFDDLPKQNLENIINLNQEFDVQWIPHPNWYYRISKFALPFIESEYAPQSFFLNEITTPLPLEEYVLKPLFSYAGMGVVLDVSQEIIDKIPDPENWILQQKVNYANVIATPDEPAKLEVRLFYFKKKEWSRPKAVHNLARLSKGKMIGTRYNEGKTWVGGTIAYFEKPPQSPEGGS